MCFQFYIWPTLKKKLCIWADVFGLAQSWIYVKQIFFFSESQGYRSDSTGSSGGE